MKKIVLLRSYGGLGNQCFQLFFARCVLRSVDHAELKVYFSDNYSVKRKFFFGGLGDLNTALTQLEKWILALRIPRILSYVIKRDFGRINFLNYIILDGYYQNVKFYKEFRMEYIQEEKLFLRNHLCSGIVVNNNTLWHFRLMDFFENEASEVSYLQELLKNLPKLDADVISNRDIHFLKRAQRHSSFFGDLRYIETTHYSDHQLLTLMCSYKKIVTMGSTLAFWASVFSSAELGFFDSNFRNSSELSDLHAFLTSTN